LPGTGNYVLFDGEIKNGTIINEQFVPGLELSPATRFNGKLDFNNHIVQAGMNSDKIVYRGIVLSENAFNINTKNDRVFAEFNNSRIVLKDSTENDKTVFGIDNLELNANVGNDSLTYGVFWDNKDSLLHNYGTVEGYFVTNTAGSDFVISKSDVVINDRLDTSEEYMKALRSFVPKIINFEDNGSGTQLADLVINALYPEKQPYPRHYYGYEYFCARDEFINTKVKKISELLPDGFGGDTII
jgi:hypothetical protein